MQGFGTSILAISSSSSDRRFTLVGSFVCLESNATRKDKKEQMKCTTHKENCCFWKGKTVRFNSTKKHKVLFAIEVEIEENIEEEI